MSRAILTMRQAWPITLVITIAVSLLPGGVLRVFNPFKDVQNIMLGPFTQLGGQLGAWLRPAVTSADSDEVRQLRENMDDYKRLYLAEQARVEQLRGQVEQLQRAVGEPAPLPPKVLLAPIGARSPFSSLGQVTLNRGSTHGVAPGAVAVYNGDQLLGRVTSDVSSVHCSLLPLANKDTGPMMVKAISKSGGGRLPVGTGFQVEPQGDGTFIADPDKSLLITEGDEVRLFDSTWPDTAQGMIIGIVTSVNSNDAKPLRNRVVVMPALQVSQLKEIVIKIDAVETDGQAGGGRR